jgi:SAM-dependent methyltransferase
MDCTFCGDKTTNIMDFGNVALAGAFLRPNEFDTEEKYPLELYFCESCYAVEVGEKIHPDVLFKKYFYSSSAIPKLNQHFKDYAEYIVDRFRPNTVVEIGCNDGVMLRHLDKLTNAIGVDPSDVVDNSLTVINDYFTMGTVEQIGQADVIIANNVFAHIRDIKQTTKAIKECLSDNGVFVFEVHSLLDMVDKNQYDWVYHEHLYYYSLLSLEKHFNNYGMRIFDVEDTGLHAGSRRYFVCKDDRPSSESVYRTRYLEIEEKLYDVNRFRAFAENAKKHKKELVELLNKIKAEGKTIAGYGACGRANTMIQYCGITQLEYIIDDAPIKQGYYTPSSHYEIKANPTDNLPDYVLVFAWSFFEDIAGRCNTNLIIPLPNIHIKERI